MNEKTQVIESDSPQGEKKSAWFLITGIIFGVILGLIYSLWVNPVIIENAHPANLDQDNTEIYRSTIAQVYMATGNLDRAIQRLELLNDQDVVFSLGAQAQRALAAGEGDQAYALALLASVIQSVGQPTQLIPTATLKSIPTQTLPMPTQSP